MAKPKQVEETALVARGGSSHLVSSMPDYLREKPTEPIRGGENVEKGDFIVPRLSICGKQSPQFDENNERYIEGLRLGDFFNSVTRENFGPIIYVVPLMEVKTRSKNRKYGEDGPPFCVSADSKTGEGDPGGECRTCAERHFTQVNGKSVAPRCTEIMSYGVLLMPPDAVPPEHQAGKTPSGWPELPRTDTMSLIGFKSTSIGSAKTWNTLLQFRGRDWFSGVYRLNSLAKSDVKNSWYIPIVENAGWLSLEGYQVAEPCYTSLREIFVSGRARVDEFDDKQPEASGASAGRTREPGDDDPDETFDPDQQ